MNRNAITEKKFLQQRNEERTIAAKHSGVNDISKATFQSYPLNKRVRTQKKGV